MIDLLIAAGLLAPLLGAGVGPAPASRRVPIVVELFTSEGCSSCPPADDALARLVREQPVPGVEVLALSEHVDYWNYIGWSDPFSSAQFTERQESYAPRLSRSRIYTPQAIVDGRLDVLGSDEAGLRRALSAAAGEPRGALDLRRLAAGAAGLNLVVEASRLSAPGEALVAIVEDGLASQVSRGENAGRTLVHAAVVRALRSVGQTSEGSFRGELQIPIAAVWNRKALRAIAFVQARDGRILAAGGLPLAP